MNEYWTGVFLGCVCAMIFFIICLFVLQWKLSILTADFNELKTEHNQICEWITENETVMKTYEFFNENIKKLLEEKQNDKN